MSSWVAGGGGGGSGGAEEGTGLSWKGLEDFDIPARCSLLQIPPGIQSHLLSFHTN